MSDGRVEFENRLNRLLRRHHSLARGYKARLRADELIVRTPRRVAFRLPLRGFVLLMGMLMMFKGFVLATSGEAVYRERLTILENGTLPERAGAVVMAIDPVSQVIADILSPYV